MPPRPLLIVATQAPFYGGAAGFAFLLFEWLQDLGYDAHYLTVSRFYAEEQYRRAAGDQWRNPTGRANVHTCLCEGYAPDELTALAALLHEIGPVVGIGVNHLAPVLLKRALPECDTWFLPTSCAVVKNLCTAGRLPSLGEAARQLDGLDDLPWWRVAEPTSDEAQREAAAEREAIERSDRIVFESALTQRCFEALYPTARGKIEPHVLWGARLFQRRVAAVGVEPLPFHARPIDVLFVATRWRRPEKRYDLVKELIERCEGLDVHVVGECTDPVPGAHYHGLLTNRSVLNLMARTKVVVVPSSADSSPNVLFEASLLGCNVVASQSCGNWELCHPDLLAEPYGPDAFEQCIRRAVRERRADNLRTFLDPEPWERLRTRLDDALQRA